MAVYELIAPEQALTDLGAGVLLVNGYDDEERWEMTQVPGAISYMDFTAMLGEFPRDAEIMFYCA